MKPLSASLIVVAMIALGGIALAQDKNKLPEAVQTLLAKGETFELYSLGAETKDDKGFHGYKVLGKTTIKDAKVRAELLTAFTKGMEGKIVPARCFIPRDGIRVTDGEKTVDLVICFECSHFRVHQGNDTTHLLVNNTPEPAFVKLLAAAKIPRAK